MSYCRWSTDNFQCDLYCYADASGGWTTHVASNRHVGGCPKVDWSLLSKCSEQDSGAAEELCRQSNAQHKWLMECERLPIGLAYDGRTFNDPTLQAFKATLLLLREAGYRFPDEVLEEVDEEIACGEVVA